MDGSAVNAPDTVIVVGPAEIVGPTAVDGELVAAAFDSIDDAVALVGERVVPVDEVWRQVMMAAVAPGTRTALLICPSWWRSARIELIRTAAREVANDVVQLPRVDVLRHESKVIVEIAPDFAVVHSPDEAPCVVPRVGDPRDVAISIDARIDGSAVVIDVPGRMDGATRLSGELAHVLRLRGVSVLVADDQRVLRAARDRPAGRRRIPRFTQARVTALAGAGLVVAGLAGAAAGYGADEPATATSTWLVEGRVAVEVPAGWPTERIHSGPGSARVQVISPVDPHVAIQVIQSPGQESLAVAAEVLRRALGDQPEGVFVDFTAGGSRAEKSVITYREIRAEHHVDWTVMLDRGVRIAIGCQHEPDRPAPERICDAAIRSARTLT
jgi:type VII secretion-associated protein (TIGR03931 family)